MTRPPTWLLEHKRDVYSQTGEDGILEMILATLPAIDKWCVEFGAWDGLHLSNTRHLIESQGYSAVLIEPNKGRFDRLRRTHAQRKNVFPIKGFVGFEENDNLDKILSGTPIPEDFDLLSIDIDGNDYHAWKAVSRYRPKVVVVEFNPTIPTPVRFVQLADPSVSQGSSLLSLVDLGKEKGYELVAVLPFNAFFVRKDLYELFQLTTNSPEVLRTDLESITYVFSGFDGKLFLSGHRKLPWHRIDLGEEFRQELPKYLQTFPERYSRLQKVAFALFLLATRPRTFVGSVRYGFPWS